MSSEFDPYRIWLGIPANEQPANLYRLLGLALFESDEDVISNAADRQMAHIRTFQSGKYSEQSQKLLNELSSARVTLLDKNKKAEYDAKLKSELESSAGSSMVNLTPPPAQGSFIGGPSSVNLAPPPVNGAEGSLLGVDFGLSTASKKKHSSTTKNPDRTTVKDKSVKSSPTTYSSGKRSGSKSSKNNNTGMVAGLIVGAAVLLLGAFLLISSSSSRTAQEQENDRLLEEALSSLPQQNQSNTPYREPQPQRPNKTNRPKASDKTETPSKEGDFKLPPPTADVAAGADHASDKPEDGKTNESQDSENSSVTDAQISVDLAELTSVPGQVKQYDQIKVAPILTSLLPSLNQAQVPSLQLSSDGSLLYVGTEKKGKCSVVNVATGNVVYNMIPNNYGVFAGFAATQDGKMFFRAINPPKSDLQVFKDELNKPVKTIEVKTLRNLCPKSRIYRYDEHGQPYKEEGNDDAFAVFDDGYQILQMAPPPNVQALYMTVALTDGLVHVVDIHNRKDFIRFYPSNDPAPEPVLPSDVESAKRDELQKHIIMPNTVPTAMVFQSSGNLLATGNSQGEVFIWDIEDYEQVVDSAIYGLQKVKHLFYARLSEQPVIGLRFDSTGKNLYAFWADGSVGVWDWKANQLIKSCATGQQVKYAQILADKYLLLQNQNGEVTFWSWDVSSVRQTGKFIPKTELVIANPEHLLFWATIRDAEPAQLTMYALPTDFVVAEQDSEFAKLFRADIIYSVPDEAKWNAKLSVAENNINKSLKDDFSDQQKVNKIHELVEKMAESRKIEPDLRYALYMKFIQIAVQMKDKTLLKYLVDSVLKEFDINQVDLNIYADLLLFAEMKKPIDFNPVAKEILDLAEVQASRNIDKAIEAATAVSEKDYLLPALKGRAKELVSKFNKLKGN